MSVGVRDYKIRKIIGQRSRRMIRLKTKNMSLLQDHVRTNVDKSGTTGNIKCESE